MESLIGWLVGHVPGIANVVVSVHTHDDLGMATANALAAVRAGARQIECTINGIGERAVNCALEEVVVALRTRRDAFGIETRFDPSAIARISRAVATATRMRVQRNKAIVGATPSPINREFIRTEFSKLRQPTRSSTPVRSARNARFRWVGTPVDMRSSIAQKVWASIWMPKLGFALRKRLPRLRMV